MGGPNPNRIYVDNPSRPSYDDGPRYYDDSPGYDIDDESSSGGFPGEPPPPRGGGRRRKRSIFWRMRRLMFLAGLAVMAMIAAGVAVIANSELPEADVLIQSSLICAADVTENCNAQNAMAQLSGAGDRENVKLDRVPEILVDAIIDSEDADFRTHKGLSPVAISRALYWDIRSGTAVQGGSTITQQYVKNRFLNSEQTITRKLKEAVLAVKLEQSMSKDEILEGYLNTIFFGRNAYGIQAASRAYYNKPVDQVTELREVAYLAGLIRAPNRADASNDEPAAKDRRTKVLVAMLDAGHITQKQYDETVDLPFDYVRPIADAKKSTRKMGDKGGVYITEYVQKAINRNPAKYNLTEQDVQLGGLRVYTTIDPKLQAAAWDSLFNPAVNTDYPLDRPELPQGSLVSIDNEGNVRAMVGGRGDGTGTNFAVRGHGSNGRPVGSTYKPVVLATAVDLGYSLESTVPAKKKDTVPQIPGCDPWTVRNAGESEYPGERIDLVTATKASVNTAYAHLIYELAHANGDSTKDVTAMAEKLGMDLDEDFNECLPMVLGANNSAPMEMAEMYSTFANRGEHKEPRVISKIDRVDQDGNSVTVYRAQSNPTRVLAEEKADIITHTLQQAISEGTGKRANIPGKDVAGKTGTTADNKDAVFVGYTPYLTTAVWMGFENKEQHNWINPECIADATSGLSQQELEDAFSPYAKYAGNPDGCPAELAKMGSNGGVPVYDFGTVTGGSIPAHIWKLYMTVATEGRNEEFVEPSKEALRKGTRLDTGDYDDGSAPVTTTTLPQDDDDGPPWTGPDVSISIPDRPGSSTTTSTTDPGQSTTTSSICWPPRSPDCEDDGGGG